MASDPPYVETAAAAVNASRSSSSFVIGALRREMEAEDASGAEGTTAIHRLAVALQAALLDAGFVAATNPPGSRLGLLKDWSAAAPSTLTVKYTIPELVEAAEQGKTVVVLNYSLMSNFAMIYACVPGAQSEVRRLCLELPRLAPLLYLLDSNAVGAAEEEKEVLEIWRVLKDELCLPLMISLCQLNGLSLPPCLMALPDEMKAMILELVPGVDLAKVQCTCKELKGLAADNGLWERKFVLELNTIGEGSRWSRDWKKWFQVGWTRKVDNTRRQVEENARRQRKRPRPRSMDYGWGNSPPSPHNFLLGDEGLEFTDYYSGQYMDYRWWNSPASPPNFMAFDDDSDRLPYTTYWV